MSDNFSYLLPFVFLVFGGIFLVGDRWSPGSARFWGMGYILAALGFGFPILAQAQPLKLQACISQFLFFSAFFFYGHALLVRFRRPTWLLVRLGLAAIGLSVVVWIITVREDLRAELAVGDAWLALILGVSVMAVWRHATSLIDKILVAMALLVVMETMARVAALLAFTSSGSYASLDQFLSSDYAFLMQVGASIIGFIMALTVLGSVMADVVSGYRWSAEHDPLTDLLNRRGFEEAVPKSHGGAFPAGAMIVADIDHFKQVNDSHGHAAGDHVIIQLGLALKASLKGSPVIARFGGEEFVAFLPGVNRSDAAQMAEEARLAFAATDWREHGIDGLVTASFGVSTTARGDHSVHDAIGRADACLYLAKNSGRNQVVTEGQRPPDSPPPLRVVS